MNDGFGVRSIEIHAIFRNDPRTPGSCDDSLRLDPAGRPASGEEVIQADGRIRRWAPIQEMQGRYLRVVLLADGETVHNAFFDRSFTR